MLIFGENANVLYPFRVSSWWSANPKTFHSHSKHASAIDSDLGLITVYLGRAITRKERQIQGSEQDKTPTKEMVGCTFKHAANTWQHTASSALPV